MNNGLKDYFPVLVVFILGWSMFMWPMFAAIILGSLFFSIGALWWLLVFRWHKLQNSTHFTSYGNWFEEELYRQNGGPKMKNIVVTVAKKYSSQDTL